MRVQRSILLVFGSVACSDGTVKAPAAPPSAEAVVAAIQSSDDFERYRESFVSATTELVVAGRCTLAELKDVGGVGKVSK